MDNVIFDKKPLISVIVPVYNVEKDLERCVLSLINQKYQNIEIILVDDGSTDGSTKICDSLKRKDNRIKVIHKKNGGLSDARNHGLAIANGDFISFVDSDDVVNHHFIDYLFKLQNKYNADIVSCSFRKIYSNVSINELIEAFDEADIIVRNGRDCIKEYLDRKTEIKIYHNVWNKLYKASLFDGIRFKEGKLHEDLFITYRLIDKCNCMVSCNAELYYYNKANSNSIVSTYNGKNLYDQCEAINEIYNYFINNEDCKTELSYFIVNNSIDLYLTSYIIKDDEVSFSRKSLRRLIIKCSSNISFYDKVKVYIKLFVPCFFRKTTKY